MKQARYASRFPPLYQPDLADIQAQAYGGHVAASAPGLLARLADHDITRGRVIDLGCGDGAWLARLSAAGYRAVGVDASPALCAHARIRAPDAEVRCASLDHADLAGAAAVTALGEVFNYLPPRGRVRALTALFRRIAAALPSGGLLLFDVIVAGSRKLDGRFWVEGDDWLLAVQMQEDRVRGRAERRITVFRRQADAWRRSDEVHRLRIPATSDLLAALRAAGFAAQVRQRWHQAPLLPGRRAFIARKR